MLRRSNEDKKIIVLGFVVVALTLLVSWSFDASNVRRGLFTLDQALLCYELDENNKPYRIRDNFPRGVEQVCLWFRYSSARVGDALEVLWKRDNKPVQRESFRVANRDERNGFRAFCLIMEQGGALRDGNYEVEIFYNGRSVSHLRFRVN